MTIQKKTKEGYSETWYNKFNKDPYDESIPDEIKNVYTWSDGGFKPKEGSIWSDCDTCYYNPKVHPEEYVECTAFVYMSFNMNGIKLPGGLGNAEEWANKNNEIIVDGKRLKEGANTLTKDDDIPYTVKDVFNVYTSGESKDPIEKGDIMVWDERHVGVVGEIYTEDKSFVIANANSDQPTYIYYWREDNGTIKILDNNGNEIKWRPKHWMRLKENYEKN